MATDDKFPIVFLDRDGTIIVDKIYLNDPDGVEFLEGAQQALKRVCDAGFKIVIVTNQSGVAKGLVQIENLNLIHQKIKDSLSSYGVEIFRIYFCPHPVDGNCNCRKPKTGMVKEIENLIDKEKSFMIGDKETDIEFGINLGIKTILLTDNLEQQTKANYKAKNLLEAVDIILQS